MFWTGKVELFSWKIVFSVAAEKWCNLINSSLANWRKKCSIEHWPTLFLFQKPLKPIWVYAQEKRKKKGIREPFAVECAQSKFARRVYANVGNFHKLPFSVAASPFLFYEGYAFLLCAKPQSAGLKNMMPFSLFQGRRGTVPREAI